MGESSRVHDEVDDEVENEIESQDEVEMDVDVNEESELPPEKTITKRGQEMKFTRLEAVKFREFEAKELGT